MSELKMVLDYLENIIAACGIDMNERIKELMRQAGFGPTANPYERQAFDVNMFAELIFQDCIANVKAWEKDSRNHISYMLKQHYGIKE